MNLAEGECEWAETHPPHLWGEALTGIGVKVWACSGEAADGQEES